MTDFNVTETKIGEFKCINFLFEGKNARVIFPNTEKNGKWIRTQEMTESESVALPLGDAATLHI